MVRSCRPRIPPILRVSVVAALAAAALQAQQSSAPQLPRRVDAKSQQVLDRTIQALGGQEFLHVKTLTTKGRIFAIQDGTTAGLEPFQSYTEYPSKRRFSYGKTMPVVLINNGDKGWEIDRYGLISQPPEQLRRWIASNRYSFENLLRVRIQEAGVLIQAGGTDFMDNAPTQEIGITEVGGTTVRLDVNRLTFLPTRVTYLLRNPTDGTADEFSDAYSDFKLYDGIQTPMHITRYMNGDRVGETFRNFAKYNEDYPANYFTAE